VTSTADGELHIAIGQQQAAASSLEQGVAMVPFRPGRPEEFTFVVHGGRAVRVDYGEWGTFYRMDRPLRTATTGR
jgi:hypothetical protein